MSFLGGCLFGICFGAMLKADRDVKFVATLFLPRARALSRSFRELAMLMSSSSPVSRS